MKQRLKARRKSSFLIIGLFVFLVLLGLALARENTMRMNYEINETIAEYFTAFNRKDYAGMEKYLYPENDNRDYLLMTKAKADAVEMQSIHLQKIYPALVDGDFAVVGVETSTIHHYASEYTTIKEANTLFLRKHKGKWYVAKPEDLDDVSLAYKEELIERYSAVVAENIKSPKEFAIYNYAAFEKIKVDEENHTK